MTPHDPSGLPATGAAAAAAGAAAIGGAASACCSTPAVATLTISLFGASGAAWAAGFAPYAGWMLAGAAIAIVYGLHSVRRSSRTCGDLEAAGPSRSLRFARWSLGLAAALWLLAVAVRLAPLVSGATP